MFKKALPLLVLITLFVTILMGCSRQENGAGTDATKTQDTASASLKLTVVAPAGWTVSKTNPNLFMKGTGTFSIMQDAMPGDVKTPDAYIDTAKAGFQKSFKNCVFVSSSLKVSGNDARRLDISGDASGVKMNFIMLYVFKDYRVYILMCSGMADSFAGLKADYEKIVASAKLE